MKNTEEELLLRICRHLLCKASFLTDLGLIKGKMGIVIFFCHYARYTKEKIYDEFAGDLLEEIYNEIDKHISLYLENGLCGIGWGIEYLVQNTFMEGETNEILEAVDLQIMDQDPQRITDYSFLTGLGGLLYYVLSRLNSPKRNRNCLPFDNRYLSDLHVAALQLIAKGSDKKSTEIAEKYVNYKKDNVQLINCDDLESFVISQPVDNDITKWKLGLQDGCAGRGLKILLS